MEASSQIQNLLCLLLLHLCSSFFHYLTLNQVSEVGTTDRNGGNYLIAIIHRGQKFKETMEAFQQKRAEFIAQEIRNFDTETLCVQRFFRATGAESKSHWRAHFRATCAQHQSHPEGWPMGQLLAH